MTPTKFNIRVYGILFDHRNRILVADELIHGQRVTKFPGGGLEFGEGTIDCVIREFMEETNQAIQIIRHVYTTDFFQQSAFNPNHQVMSIYYLVECSSPEAIITSGKKFDFLINETSDVMSLRWIESEEIQESDFTFPIDQKVAKIIKSGKY